MDTHTSEYWDACYKRPKAGWDIGYVSTPLQEYFDQLTNKELRILVPGAGLGWEVEYLYNQGFKNVFLLDFSEKSLVHFSQRCPEFPANQVIVDDFFTHQGSYDLIVEQTFFCSLVRWQRVDYMRKMFELLSPGGKLVGLLFNHEFDFNGPPYGGEATEYEALFHAHFELVHFSVAHNSIKPRRGRELFFVARNTANKA